MNLAGEKKNLQLVILNFPILLKSILFLNIFKDYFDTYFLKTLLKTGKTPCLI